ncbi:MAG TPA: hypothetical protein VLD40_06790 [Dissulfurispiraceae bacterium]|nr:hypothetical protein [Dissulfurispiraceae bacterium]
MNQLFVIALLKWASVAWAGVVTMMLVASAMASIFLTDSFGEGFMRLTQVYGGLARVGYDEEADSGMILGNAIVVLLLYFPAFVLYAFHENYRKGQERGRR